MVADCWRVTKSLSRGALQMLCPSEGAAVQGAEQALTALAGLAGQLQPDRFLLNLASTQWPGKRCPFSVGSLLPLLRCSTHLLGLWPAPRQPSFSAPARCVRGQQDVLTGADYIAVVWPADWAATASAACDISCPPWPGLRWRPHQVICLAPPCRQDQMQSAAARTSGTASAPLSPPSPDPRRYQASAPARATKHGATGQLVQAARQRPLAAAEAQHARACSQPEALEVAAGSCTGQPASNQAASEVDQLVDLLQTHFGVTASAIGLQLIVSLPAGAAPQAHWDMRQLPVCALGMPGALLQQLQLPELLAAALTAGVIWAIAEGLTAQSIQQDYERRSRQSTSQRGNPSAPASSSKAECLGGRITRQLATLGKVGAVYTVLSALADQLPDGSAAALSLQTLRDGCAQVTSLFISALVVPDTWNYLDARRQFLADAANRRAAPRGKRAPGKAAKRRAAPRGKRARKKAAKRRAAPQGERIGDNDG